MKEWINRAIGLLDSSLSPIPHELNELDWKEDLSPNNKKLTQHIRAFANYPNGGFLVFGVQNGTGKVLGIDANKAEKIVQTLSNLSRDTVEPHIAIDHTIETYLEQSILIVYIKESSTKPVHLKKGTIEDTYIRSGGTTKKASRQEIGELMLNSKNPIYEELHSTKVVDIRKVYELLDVDGIFTLLQKPVPFDLEEVINVLQANKMMERIDENGFYITNLGALTAAKSLIEFDSLARKAVRVIKYKGKNKVVTEREYPGRKGYAISFERLIEFIKILLPSSEVIKSAFRHETSIYPDIALRELVANALVHQDLSVTGAGPMIDIFDDRIEISSPGRLLPSKKLDRLIGTNPESRNDKLASTFRRMKICEERGSGFQKAVSAVELFGLPPLKFVEMDNSFKVVMFAPKSFADLTPAERIEAAYQHSIIQYFSSGGMSNTSLRQRFKMNDKQRSQVSVVIREALEQGKIKPKDPNNKSTKFVEYIPYWV